MKIKQQQISVRDKLILYSLTIFIDICLLLVLLDNTNTLEHVDRIFIYSMFVTHLLLYYCLYYNNYKYVSFLQIILVLSLCFGYFLESIHIQFLILALLTFIKILWITEKKCISNTKKGFYTMQNVLTIGIIFYYGLLSLRVGYRWGSQQ